MRWRAVYVPLAATLLLAGCIFGDGDGSPTATPEATPTAEVTALPTGVATAIGAPGELPPGLEVSASGTWESRKLRAGDEVPDVLGAFVFDVEAGVGTLWSLAPGAVENPDYVFVETSVSGDYIVANNHLVNTGSGESFVWGPRTGLLTVDDRGLALFPGGDCSFWAVDLSGEEPVVLTAFALAEEQVLARYADLSNCNVAARFSPDGSTLLIALQSNLSSGGALLYSVDVASGSVAMVGEAESSYVVFADRTPPDRALLSFGSPGLAWVGEYSWETGEFLARGVATGQPPQDEDRGPPAPGGVRPSPDGSWVAWSEFGDVGVASGSNGGSEWPVVVIGSLNSREPVVRAQRVATTNGVIAFDWLPDSSALVVQSEEGFALLSPGGNLIEMPFPMASHLDPVPVPAPDAPGRFAYDGRVVDAAGADVGATPAVAEAWGSGRTADERSWWSRTRYYWGATAARMVFVRTEISGGDFGRGGIASLGLPPRVVMGADAAQPGEIRLRVASDGDRLNLRASPGASSERVGQLPDGAALTMARDARTTQCGVRGCSILRDPDASFADRWWLFVQSDDGLEGWVDAAFVDWGDR